MTVDLSPAVTSITSRQFTTTGRIHTGTGYVNLVLNWGNCTNYTEYTQVLAFVKILMNELRKMHLTLLSSFQLRYDKLRVYEKKKIQMEMKIAFLGIVFEVSFFRSMKLIGLGLITIK